MDKQKQIEEMAKYICGYVQSKELDSLKLISWKSGNPLFLGVSHNYGVAEYLHDAGYRKIPELPKDTVLKTDDIAELLTVVAKDTRKETAEKFAEKVSKAFIGLNCIDIDEWNWCQRKIDEICKEIIGEKV